MFCVEEFALNSKSAHGTAAYRYYVLYLLLKQQAIRR
jgi:hypothetical protein